MKTNILLLSPDRPKKSMGGLGVHVFEILKRIDTDKYNVTALCQCSEDYSIKDGVNIYGVETYETGVGKNDAFASTYLIQSKFVSRYMQLCQDKLIAKPSIIHCCDWSCSPASIEIANVTGAKIVFAVHLSINNYIKKINPLQLVELNIAKHIEFEACRSAFQVLQVSEAYSDMYPFMIYKHKTTIVPNGVDYSCFADSKPYPFPGKEKIKILYIGRLEQMKNVDTLMNIDIPRGCDLIFCGGTQGSSEELINNLKEIEKNNSRVHYVGPLYGQEKYNAMCSADLIIMPSRHEPFGMVALEACAAAQGGKTILASSFADGMKEFLTNDCAIDCGIEKESIEKAIVKFLMMSDVDKQNMRINAMEVAKKYSWENTVSIISNVYDKLNN